MRGRVSQVLAAGRRSLRGRLGFRSRARLAAIIYTWSRFHSHIVDRRSYAGLWARDRQAERAEEGPASRAPPVGVDLIGDDIVFE
jgi:hypothetical protein